MLSPRIPLSFAEFKKKYHYEGHLLNPYLESIYTALIDCVKYASSLQSATERIQQTIIDIDEALSIAKLLKEKATSYRIKGHVFSREASVKQVQLALQSDLRHSIQVVLEPYWIWDDDPKDDDPEDDPLRVEYHEPFEAFNSVIEPIDAAFYVGNLVWEELKNACEEIPENEILSDEKLDSLINTLQSIHGTAKRVKNQRDAIPRYAFLASVYKACPLKEDNRTLSELYWCLKVFGCIDEKTLATHTSEGVDLYNSERFMRTSLYNMKKLGFLEMKTAE